MSAEEWPKDFRPTLCQRCTAMRLSETYLNNQGWVCWKCYEELRPRTKADEELERRMPT